MSMSSEESHRQLMAYTERNWAMVNASNTGQRTPGQQAAHDENREQTLDAVSNAIWGLWYAGPIVLVRQGRVQLERTDR